MAADNLQELVLKITGDSSHGQKAVTDLADSLKSAFENPLASLETFGKALLNDVAGPLGTAGAAMGVFAGVAVGIGVGLFELANKAAEAGEQVLDFSRKTGESVENVGALKFAADVAGTSLDQLSSIQIMLERRLAAGGPTAEKMGVALGKLGISADEFKQAGMEDRIRLLSDGFRNASPEIDKTGLAIQIMGRAGAQSLPMLMKDMGDLIDKGHAMGINWTDTAAKAEEFKESSRLLSTEFDMISTRIGAALLPVFTDLISSFANSKDTTDGFASILHVLAGALGYVVQVAGVVVAGFFSLGAAFVNIVGIINNALIGALTMVQGVLLKVAAFDPTGMAQKSADSIGGAVDFLNKKQAGLTTAYNEQIKAGGAVYDVSQKVSGALSDLADGHDKTAAATENHKNKTEALTTAKDALKKKVDALVASLEGEGKNTQAMSQAITDVIKQQDLDVDAKTRVIAMMDQLRSKHVDLIAAQQKFYDDNKDLSASYQGILTKTQTLWDEYYKTIAKDQSTTLDIQLTGLDAWYNKEYAAIEKSAKTNKDAWESKDALDADFYAKRQAAQDADTQHQIDTQEKVSKAWDDYYKVVDTVNHDSFAGKMVDIGKWYDAQYAVLVKAAKNDPALWDELDALNATYYAKQMQAIYAVENALPGIGTEILNVGRVAAPALTDLNHLILSVGDNIQKTLGAAPDLIINALTGGGGLSGAVKAIGSNLGKDLGTSLEKDLTKSLTDGGKNALGDMSKGLLAAIPVVGAMIGPALSMLFSIGGPSAAELAGRKAAESFTTAFNTSLSVAAPGATQLAKDLSSLQQAYITLGMSAGDAAVKAQTQWNTMQGATKKGADAVNAAGQAINDVMAQATAKLSAAATGVTTLVSAVSSAGTSMPDSLKATIRDLASMPGLTDAEKSSITALADSAKPNFAALETTASNYGISLQALGPKFEQAHIDATAKQIFSDFTDLSAAGGDVGGILLGMSGKISQLVTDSKNFGTAIPENFKPLLQNLVEAGKLTDENGQSIKDLTGIQFESTPLDAGTNAIVKAITDLKDVLLGLPQAAATAATGIGNALSSVKPPTINIPYKYTADNTLPDGSGSDSSYGANGGLVTSTGVSYLGTGGPVFAPRGIDTIPAMLAIGEGVVSRTGMRGLGTAGLAAINRGARASSPANVVVNVYGNVWQESDLVNAVGQGLADTWMQHGGTMPLGH